MNTRVNTEKQSKRGRIFLIGRTLVIAGLVCCSGLVANAQEAQPLAQDPVVEKRLMAISAELRCLVCQNESLAASNAELAVDLRREIRTMITDNRSDQQILDFLVDRYGDFVRYRPPFKPLTWLLWLGPLLLGISGMVILFVRTRKSTPQVADRPESTTLTPEQIAIADQLLRPDGTSSNDASQDPAVR